MEVAHITCWSGFQFDTGHMVPYGALVAAHPKDHTHTLTLAWRQLLQVAHMTDVLSDGWLWCSLWLSGRRGPVISCLDCHYEHCGHVIVIISRHDAYIRCPWMLACALVQLRQANGAFVAVSCHTNGLSRCQNVVTATFCQHEHIVFRNSFTRCGSLVPLTVNTESCGFRLIHCVVMTRATHQCYFNYEIHLSYSLS